MKRRFILEENIRDSYIPVEIPENLTDYAAELRLLKGVPIEYLVSDPAELEEESIRFFYVDINWTDALLDGAFSIGRVCAKDYEHDRYILRGTSKEQYYIETPRMKRMHPNHKEQYLCGNYDLATEDYTKISGFLMRSKLVSRMKGMHVYGFSKEIGEETTKNMLNILRMETIADDLLICLFSGDLYEILIEEPKMELHFGTSVMEEKEGKLIRGIDLRSAVDDSGLGSWIETFFLLENDDEQDGYVDRSGKLQVNKLAEGIEKELKKAGKLGCDKITPSRFAFELIAQAHRAKFTSVSKEAENG